MPTAADIIARRLYEAGVRHAWGIPGGETLALMDALGRAGITFRLCKHENAGGFMAEGAHHATGAPAVLLATIGPGVANAVNVVANAWQDQVPMIFLTGSVDPAEAMTYTHQVFDHGKLLAPVTKATLTAPDGAVDVAIDKAVAIATDDPPGPVHVDVPIRVAAAEQPDNRAPRRAHAEPSRPADGPGLEKAREVLARAERPIMIAGIDVLHHGAARTVAEFARTYGVPVITTYKAKGVLPEDDPLALGGAGLSPKADTFLLSLVGKSDFVILAGYDPIEMRVGWRNPWGADTTVVEFVARPNTHYMHRAGLSFIGDVGAGLMALADDVKPNRTWPGGEPAETRRALRDAFEVDVSVGGGNGEWGAAAVVSTARAVLPRNTVATVDSGAHRILLSQMWECYAPRTLLQSTALCTMGTALPLAIGYKAASPETPVVAFTGDAGLEMVMGELSTLRDLKLPVAIVVFVDESLALIELKQRREGLDNLGVDFGATDFPALANAMGGVGVTADTRDGLAPALKEALARDTFTIVACPIGPRAYDGKF